MIDANFRTFIQSSDFAKFPTRCLFLFFFRVLQMTRVTSHNTNQTGSFPLHHPDGVEFCSHYTLSLLPRRSRWLLLALAGYPDENSNNPKKKKVRRRAEDDGKREKAVPLTNGKPWTPEIFLGCYCVARKKPISGEKTKPQARTLISLWFCG